MLRDLEHRHTGAICFSEDESKRSLWDQAVASAKDNGVNIHHFLVNSSANRFFFVVNAPNYVVHEAEFGYCKRLGEMKITPVKSW